MDGWTIFFAFLAGIVGLITTIIWGFDIPKFIIDLIVILALSVPIIAFSMSQNTSDISAAVNFLQNYMELFVKMLPGIAIGEAVGTVVGAIAHALGIRQRYY